jgi:hypothetical protein
MQREDGTRNRAGIQLGQALSNGREFGGFAHRICLTPFHKITPTPTTTYEIFPNALQNFLALN